jgi:hypothetical protein
MSILLIRTRPSIPLREQLPTLIRKFNLPDAIRRRHFRYTKPLWHVKKTKLEFNNLTQQI